MSHKVKVSAQRSSTWSQKQNLYHRLALSMMIFHLSIPVLSDHSHLSLKLDFCLCHPLKWYFQIYSFRLFVNSEEHLRFCYSLKIVIYATVFLMLDSFSFES